LNDHTEHLVHDPGELLRVVPVAWVDAVVEREPAGPTDEQPEPDLAQAMAPCLVLAALCELGAVRRRHEGVVVRGVEEDAVPLGLLELPDPLEEAPPDLLELRRGDAVPLRPVPLAGELLHADRSDFLDGSPGIPLGQSPLALGLDHPIEDRVEEVLADRRALLSRRFRDDLVDDPSEVDVTVHLVGRPEGTELLDLQGGRSAGTSLRELPHAIRRTDVGLGADLHLAVYADHLADVEIGSPLLPLDMEMSHASPEHGSVLQVKRNVPGTRFQSQSRDSQPRGPTCARGRKSALEARFRRFRMAYP